MTGSDAAAPVPEATIMLLLGSRLVGLAGLRRKLCESRSGMATECERQGWAIALPFLCVPSIFDSSRVRVPLTT